MLRRSWVEIDLNKIESNYRIYKSQLQPGMEIMAVVKADAYGHGALKVAKRLRDVGCKNFAVSNIEEGIELREAGISGQVLVLGYTPISSSNELVRYDITQALLSEEYAKQLSNKGIKAQFAIDTGMNRIGLDADYPEACEKIIRDYANEFKLTGMFTHLCVADNESEKEFTHEQISKFKAVAERVPDLKLANIHCMNSAGGLWCEPYGNLVRLGIILYGLKPDYSNNIPSGIEPALKWKSVLSMIKAVHLGETVGYGRSYIAEKEMLVATIPTGYADGYNRQLSNRGKVLIGGKTANIIGRVCMDQMMVDVSDISDVKIGDEVILIGEGYSADDMAQDIGTIGYEVICDISKRVPRVYL